MHRDSGNVGQSMTMSMGPCFGGALCIHEAQNGVYNVAAPGRWTRFSGLDPHMTMPFVGCRVAIVAFTHTAAYTSGTEKCKDLLRPQCVAVPPDFGAVKFFF